MPNWGKLFTTPVWQYRATSTVVSFTTTGTTNATVHIKHQCTCESLWTPDVVDVNVGVYLSVESTDEPGSVGTNYLAQVPALGISYSHSDGTYSSAAELICEFTNVKVYTELTGGLPNVQFDAVNIYKNGSLVQTYTGATLVGNGLGPAYFPIFGVPPKLSAVGTVAITQTNPLLDFSGNGNASGTGGGGVRYKDPTGTSWISANIQLPPFPSGLNPDSFCTASDTWDTTINWMDDLHEDSGSSGGDRIVHTSETLVNGWVFLWPSPPRRIIRWWPEYCAIWLRGGFPQASLVGLSSIGTRPPGVVNTTYTSYPYTRQSQFLATVQDGAHIIENPLNTPCYAPCSFVNSQNTSNFDTMTFTSNSYQGHFPDTVDTSSANPQQFGYLDHADPFIRLFNYWGNPHWSFFLWHQDWSGITYAGYWGEERDQWIYNAALPPGEQLKCRSSVITSSCEESGLTPFLDAFMSDGEGLGYRWIGACRWLTYTPAVQASMAPDQTTAAAWTLTNCTATFAPGGITLTPTGGHTVLTVDYDMGRWTDTPYMYAHFAQQIAVNWGAANIDGMVVELVGIDGATVQLATVPGTYSRPSAVGSDYAGSWAIDNGLGVLSDTGVDVPAGGVSAPTMADPERSFAFQLLQGLTAAKLRFIITVHSSGSTCLLNYPVFYAPTLPPAQVWESGQCESIAWPNGSGVRYGNWEWWDGLEWVDPPNDLPLGYKPTIIDMLAWLRIVLQGVDPLTGGGSVPSLTTLLASLYDTNEGQSISVVDKFSLAFLLPNSSNGSDATMRAALVNTMAEVPPLCAFMRGSRSTVDWSESKTVGAMDVWDMCQKPRRLISAGVRADVLTPAGAIVTSASPLSIPNWFVSEHSVQVDNTESPNWQVVTGAGGGSQKLWAHTTPWHGWFCDLLKATQGPPRAYDVSLHFRHGRVTEHLDTGHLWTGVSPNGNPYAWVDVDSGVSASSARIRWQDNRNSPLGLLYPDGSGNLLWAQTKNEGASYAAPVTIASTLATGGFFDYEETSDFLRWFYWQEGMAAPFTVYSKLLDAQNGVVRARGATNLTAADEAPIVVREIPLPAGGRTIGLLYSTGGVLTFVTDRAGKTFGSAKTVSSTAQAGGFFDFCVGSDFNLWFYWQEGAAPSTVYVKVLDRSGNTVLPRTATNVVNADLAQLAVQEFPVSGGARKIGLMYAVAGAGTYVTARDGVHFS